MKTLTRGSSEVSAWLAQGMGPMLHWFPEDVPIWRLSTTLVGMANAEGGIVLLGIAPRSREVHGISDPEGTLDRVFQAALMPDPPLVLPVPSLLPAGELEVLCITVPHGLPNVYSLDGRYWGREGVQTNPLSARRLRQLLVERGVVQFESRLPPQATLEDLDPIQVAAYLQALNLPGLAIDATTFSLDEAMQEALLRRGCLQRVGGQCLPTYAGLLLFGRCPQQWLPNATMLAARFPGASYTDQYLKQDFGGTLLEQLHLAEAFLRANLRSVVRLVGLAHQETLEIPFEAVRELLVNAVAHRDYNLQGDNIHLHLFADRLEVHSPGGLPGPVNLDNLLEARFARNAVITQVLSDMGFVERLGYGLDRVVNAMRQNGLRLPRFEEVAGTFRVTLFNDLESYQVAGRSLDLVAYRDHELNSRQQRAMGFLAHRKRITNRDYQDLCPDVHAETLRRDLVDLVVKGLLLKIGDKRATYYILKKLPARDPHEP